MQKDPLAFQRFLFLRRNVQKSQNALDAGCGMGGFTFILGEFADHVVGLTNVTEDIELARQRARRVQMNRNVEFELLDLRNLSGWTNSRKFDFAIMFEVIEHVVDDAKLLRQLAHLLVPGGRVLLTTPCIDAPHLPGARISETEDGGHVRWGYSVEELTRLCEAAGLRVLNVEGIGGPVTHALQWLDARFGQGTFGGAAMRVIKMAGKIAQAGDPSLLRISGRIPVSIGVVACRT